ncbi:hypothetical protein BDV18DRAFT_157117 [Aspergillus unguis]
MPESSSEVWRDGYWQTGVAESLANIVLLLIAGYNLLELLIWIFTTFKRHRGLYFVSMLASTISMVAWTIATLFRSLTLTPACMTAATYLAVFSYTTFLTAHIAVLYSRLHLVLPHNRHILQSVLAMIIITSVIFIPPEIVLSLVSGNYPPATHKGLDQAHKVFDIGLQVVAVVRELIICGIYIVQALRHLHPIAQMKGKTGKHVLLYLILIQVLVFILDISMFVEVFVEMGVWVAGYCTLVYTLKLKMEFGVLNALVRLVGSGGGSLQSLALVPVALSEDSDLAIIRMKV